MCASVVLHEAGPGHSQRNRCLVCASLAAHEEGLVTHQQVKDRTEARMLESEPGLGLELGGKSCSGGLILATRHFLHFFFK